MSAQFSADVRALFTDLGIEVEKVGAVKSDLVIDRFDRHGGSAAVRDSIIWTRIDVPVEAGLAA
ncbi:hypothetical protein [Amycolatopsis tolypomycina]|uniref:Uncharacterized protein n=1 Tax=Amycolatopsis tolypomycina TaxID=208445 RepID=A0A1H5A0B9_9PSEU|nr:hypothetical protein [Amycolatopsis tolypomycina]SED35886.1 hypothetical protein SAMN04489727_7551 [Amycolatopsis tolypomycina]